MVPTYDEVEDTGGRPGGLEIGGGGVEGPVVVVELEVVVEDEVDVVDVDVPLKFATRR